MDETNAIYSLIYSQKYEMISALLVNIINFSKTKNVNIFLAIKEFRRRTLIVCFVIVLSIHLGNPVVGTANF